MLATSYGSIGEVLGCTRGGFLFGGERRRGEEEERDIEQNPYRLNLFLPLYP